MTKAKVDIHDIALVYPEGTSIEPDDVLALLDELKKIGSPKKKTELNVLLNSLGGDVYTAYKLLNILRSRASKIRVIVPLYAKSAATLMALGADEIVMGHQSELGPLDAPIEHPMVEGIRLSALDGVRPLELLASIVNEIAFAAGLQIRQKVGLGRKESIEIAMNSAVNYISPIIAKLDPLVVNMCFRFLSVTERYGEEFLKEYMFKGKRDAQDLAESAISELVWEYPEHSFAISLREARRIGLTVVEAEEYPSWDRLWEEFRKLNEHAEKSLVVLEAESAADEQGGAGDQDGEA
ncbi:MAG: hypothetical protein V3U30_00610 [Thermoplasmata archaeon]